MTDYTGLVKALRCCCPQPEETCDGCPYDTAGECNISRMMFDAAAAIEELQAELPKRGVMTNADKIRSMTDEELAEWVTSEGRYFGEEYEGYMSLLDWLQEDVQDGANREF